MTKTRWTQLYYNEWGNKDGRVRRLGDGIEVWVPYGDALSWIMGTRGKKYIRDDSIEAIFVANGWARFVFDEGDEVIMRDEILEDFPRATLERVPVKQDLESGLSIQKRVDEMRARQGALGPVSWKHGRREGSSKLSQFVGLRKVAILLALVALIIASRL